MCCGIFFSYRSLLKRHDEITELSIWLYLFHLKIHRQFFYVNWKQNHKYTKKLVIFFNNHQTYSLTPLSQWKVGLHIFHCAQDCVQPVYQNAKLFAITWVSTATPSLRSIFSLGSANHTLLYGCCEWWAGSDEDRPGLLARQTYCHDGAGQGMAIRWSGPGHMC